MKALQRIKGDRAAKEAGLVAWRYNELRLMDALPRLEQAMVFDIERHQENRMKFLAALDESGTEYESIIGQKAGLSPEDTNRIGTELLDEHLVFGETGDAVHGPRLTLEAPGRALIEKYLYEKSDLAKKQPAGNGVNEPVDKRLQNTSVQIFCSYSHEDEKLRAELETHLKILERKGLIAPWNDHMIGAGEEWKGKIDKNLEDAQIILLLVSASFLASDYCYDVETKRAIERHYRGEAKVIPVILRKCDWHQAPFGKFQSLPRDGKAVTSWSNRDEAWTDVAVGVRCAVEAMTARASLGSLPKVDGEPGFTSIQDTGQQEASAVISLGEFTSHPSHGVLSSCPPEGTHLTPSAQILPPRKFWNKVVLTAAFAGTLLASLPFVIAWFYFNWLTSRLTGPADRPPLDVKLIQKGPKTHDATTLLLPLLIQNNSPSQLHVKHLVLTKLRYSDGDAVDPPHSNPKHDPVILDEDNNIFVLLHNFMLRMSMDLELALVPRFDGSGVTTPGKGLIVVGTDDNGLFRIRMFGDTGKLAKELDERELAVQAAAVEALKHRLPSLLPPHVLTDDEKEQVICMATTIIDQTNFVITKHFFPANPIVIGPGKTAEVKIYLHSCSRGKWLLRPGLSFGDGENREDKTVSSRPIEIDFRKTYK